MELTELRRLRPGVSIGQAEAEMAAVQENLDRLYPTADRNLGIDIVPLKQMIVGDTGATLLLLLGAVGIVLLIACTNVANLLLARSAARAREFAVRAALGASRARMVRQLMTESVLLALGGGVLGLGLAKVGISLVLATMPESLPRAESIGVHLPVLFFAFCISLAVGILFGLAPALRSSRVDLQASLKTGDRGSTRAHGRGQSALVIAQVALTLVLLVGAGLLVRTIRHLWNVDPGFHPQHVITFKVGLSPSLTGTPSSTRLAYRQLLERIREIPGVQAADFTNIVPLSEQDNGGPFWIGAQQSTSMQDAPHALYFETGPEYLQTMQIPLLRGRFFTAADTAESDPVVVIDSVLAHTYFPDKDPVGQTITVAHWRTARVVGVVGHVRHWGLDDPGTYNPSQIYISFYQLPDQWVPAFARSLSVAVRTQLDVGIMMPAITKVVYGTAKDQPVYDVQTMQQIASDSMASQRLPMILLGGVCRIGAGAVVGWNLWRNFLFSDSACTGDWHSHGARRSTAGCVADGYRTGSAAGACRPSDWRNRRSAAYPAAVELFAFALRGADERSVDLHDCLAGVGGRFCFRVLSSSPPRLARRSHDRVKVRIAALELPALLNVHVREIPMVLHTDDPQRETDNRS